MDYKKIKLKQLKDIIDNFNIIKYQNNLTRAIKQLIRRYKNHIELSQNDISTCMLHMYNKNMNKSDLNINKLINILLEEEIISEKFVIIEESPPNNSLTSTNLSNINNDNSIKHQ